MLADGQHRTITLSLQRASQRRQLLTDMEYLGLDHGLGPHRRWPQVRDVQGATDAHKLPVGGAVDKGEGEGGAVVEEGGGAPAVQVHEAVAVLGLDGVVEHDRGVWRRGHDGAEGDVWRENGLPVLWSVREGGSVPFRSVRLFVFAQVSAMVAEGGKRGGGGGGEGEGGWGRGENRESLRFG